MNKRDCNNVPMVEFGGVPSFNHVDVQLMLGLQLSPPLSLSLSRLESRGMQNGRLQRKRPFRMGGETQYNSTYEVARVSSVSNPVLSRDRGLIPGLATLAK